MSEPHDLRPAAGATELAALLDEIRLYLEAVDAFRREGHEPTWRRERAEEEVLR